jgi:hypothetical protein
MVLRHYPNNKLHETDEEYASRFFTCLAWYLLNPSKNTRALDELP